MFRLLRKCVPRIGAIRAAVKGLCSLAGRQLSKLTLSQAPAMRLTVTPDGDLTASAVLQILIRRWRSTMHRRGGPRAVRQWDAWSP